MTYHQQQQLHGTLPSFLTCLLASVSPIHWAARNLHTMALKMLVRAGAKISEEWL